MHGIRCRCEFPKNQKILIGYIMRKSNISSKIGAVLYVIWAALHFVAAHAVYALGQSLNPSMLQGRIFQAAWNLMFFSIAAIGVAVVLNWRNSVWGYWINFAVVGVADVGFILFVMVPGYMPVWPGVLGPVFWVLAVIFSTIALMTRIKGAVTDPAGSPSVLNGSRT